MKSKLVFAVVALALLALSPVLARGFDTLGQERWGQASNDLWRDSDLYLLRVGEETGMVASFEATSGDCTYDLVRHIHLCPEVAPPAALVNDTEVAPRSRTQRNGSSGVLLIPESTYKRVMAFDPITGDLLDPDFVPADPDHLTTPIHAILSAGGDSVLVSDQIKDVVQEYDLAGNYLGVFAPSGGPLTNILDNIRGMALRSNGNLLVTVASGANADAIAEFDTDGNYEGNFVANGSGGLGSPFDVIERQTDNLVGGITSAAIHRYDVTSGAYISDFAAIDNYPEQITQVSNGNVLVANFRGTEEGVAEYTASGALVGIYNPPTLGGYRGVYVLPNGNILTTNIDGVHEIDRAGNLVETKLPGINARFIQYAYLGGIFLAPPSTAGFGTLGSTVPFSQTLENQTSIADTFTLTVTGNAWPTALSISKTDLIPSGGSLEFNVYVGVPTGVEPGESDTATITVASDKLPTIFRDTAVLTTTALSGRYGYVLNASLDQINIVDTQTHASTGMVIDTSTYGSWPWRGALSPDGRWLYAGLGGRQDDQDNKVLIVDTDNSAGPHSAVTVGSGPHGIAFTPDGHLAFVANRFGSTVSVIDTETVAVTATIPVGDAPRSVATSPCLNKAYVTNWNSDSVSVIDVETMDVSTTIPGFANRPWDIVISPLGHRAYVSNSGSGSIGVIDTASDSLIGTWNISDGALAGLDISPDGRALYAADSELGKTFVVDTGTGAVLKAIPVGAGGTSGQSWDVEVFPAPAEPLAYASSPGGGNVQVINTLSNTVANTITLGGGPRGLALFPPNTQCAQLPTAAFTPTLSIGAVGEAVSYTNQSTGVPTPTYTWDFGDGAPASQMVHASHVYTRPGMFTVTLVASNIFGQDTVTGEIEVGFAAAAAFTPVVSTIEPGESVSFTNQTTGTAPLTTVWDFGDGSALSSTINPTHTYAITGAYAVALTATNRYGVSVAHGRVLVGLLEVYLPLMLDNSP